MTDPTPIPVEVPVLSAEDTTRLSEFARGCKAAVRAVSLYPDGHPSVQSNLTRMMEIARKVTATSPLILTVLPDNLLLDGATAEKRDPAIEELAIVLYRHQIGQLMVSNGADVETWITLLRLLGRPAEQVRAEGGISHLWDDAGGLTTSRQPVSIKIKEINYEKILRGGAVGDAALAAIIDACLGDTPDVELDEETRAKMLELVGDPGQLSAVATELRARAGENVGNQVDALLHFMKSATGVLDTSNPTQVDRAFGNMAIIVGDLSPEAMTQLLARRGTEEGKVGTLDVVGGVVGHMSPETIASFVAGSVIEEHGATERLAEAFQALVPDIDSRRQLLSLAEGQVQSSPVGSQENFPDVWRRTEQMLTEYSDEKYVGSAYARELSHARTQAVEVEETSDDPPERIHAWLETVDDETLHDLDLQLLVDLLELEQDVHRWRDIADTVVMAVEELHRKKELQVALRLVQRLADERGDADAIAGDEESKRAFALAALDRIATGPAMRHALGELRSDDDRNFEAVKNLCTILGPSVVTSLTEVLASEQDARSRRRIRDVLLSFGHKGREAVQQLLNASNWEVRQTAAFLLREFGGTEGLPELERLLTDSEPLVQREAIRAMVLIGDERTYRVLVRVLGNAKPRSASRETLIHQLTSQRDQRAAGLCIYLIENIDYTVLPDVYLAAISGLGTIGGESAVKPLKTVLHRGDWWAPFRTRDLRRTAAEALRRMKQPDATEALREASTNGSWGVRRMARAALPPARGGS